MTTPDGFEVGIEFDSVLTAISKQIYETPLAFIRENVQNAIDALRMQAARDDLSVADSRFVVRIVAKGKLCEIHDNGVGMSLDDLRNLFWKIGASGKRTAEARAAGCVGMFGIGGFANFGVCDVLEIVSQSATDTIGHWTRLSRDDIKTAGGSIPRVSYGESADAAPRGTIVRATLQSEPDLAELMSYVRAFVQYAEEHVYFNDELLSRTRFPLPSQTSNRLRPTQVARDSWSHGNITVGGTLFESGDHTLTAELTELVVAAEPARLSGWLRLEQGTIDVLKRGFKICSTTIGTNIGVSGAIDCDRLSPTAGRDSLDPESNSLVASIVASIERAAVLAILESPDRIAQHTRIFRFVRTHGLVPLMGKVIVELADGSEVALEHLRRQADGGVGVLYAASKNRALSQLLQARGNAVVQLPADHDKQIAVRDYLASFCKAQAFEGRIECAETYEGLNRFEKAFLSELEQTIIASYDVNAVTIVAGRLTEDVPVYAPRSESPSLTIYVDVRHPEITKLESLGITALFISMVAAFCREYLGETLRGKSPRFFGSGAVNLDWLAKRRSELWLLLTDDIEVLTRQTQRQVVRSADVEVVIAGRSTQPDDRERREADGAAGEPREPKLVRIEGSEEFRELFGYYLRIPSSATSAYGDVIQQADSRAVVWAGNKILLVASDAISTAFQFEVRLDRIIRAGPEGAKGANGALEMTRPLQALFSGLYFPIPPVLEPYLVPSDANEIPIEVRCDWIDFTSAHAWEARDAEA